MIELELALALWRGPALADVTGMSPQLDAMAAALDEQRMATVESQASAELAAGLAASTAARLAALVAEHPLRERLRWQLMLALYRTGRQAEALESYQEAQRMLADQLGIDPGPELRDLQARILRSDPALTLPEPGRAVAGQLRPRRDGSLATPRQLPADLRQFAGRSAELAALDTLVTRNSAAAGAPSSPAASGGEDQATGTVAITAICGTGGVGKTTLALHWAHLVADRFADGQLYVNLRGYDPSGTPLAPDEVIRGFLDALGVAPGELPPAAAARAALYRSLVAGRQLLIVLDNAFDAEQVRPMLPAAPASFVLVTSRAELAGLAVTDGASLLRLDLLTAADAADMLAARLGRPRLATDPDAVRQVIASCSRLPLALAIAAARAAATPSLPLAALAADLAGEHGRLDTLELSAAGDPATSIRVVFSWSVSGVSAPAAWLFRLIGLHPGPDISAAAAASLAGHDPRRARQELRELVAASLLTEPVPGRYSCHDLLRAYAAELAEQADSAADRRAAMHRVLDHYLHSAEHATAQIRGTNRQAPVPLAALAPRVSAEAVDGKEAVFAWFSAEGQRAADGDHLGRRT